ncbi:hypothetical protein AOQ84DRAFT_223020 [Glonium stellatum]|uniref:Uncharacterized protein n=1 Tax=Glonium stellatum TaxID=574774 RepID=A0A8E2JS93_9PEZI|nr:hypothetical protein AOQ84DRAFT_223020 [Glonium stellatum]
MSICLESPSTPPSILIPIPIPIPIPKPPASAQTHPYSSHSHRTHARTTPAASYEASCRLRYSSALARFTCIPSLTGSRGCLHLSGTASPASAIAFLPYDIANWQSLARYRRTAQAAKTPSLRSQCASVPLSVGPVSANEAHHAPSTNLHRLAHLPCSTSSPSAAATAAVNSCSNSPALVHSLGVESSRVECATRTSDSASWPTPTGLSHGLSNDHTINDARRRPEASQGVATAVAKEPAKGC